ncbi:MAG: thioredoxin family protein [Kofleriaceae bacterium]
MRNRRVAPAVALAALAACRDERPPPRPAPPVRVVAKLDTSCLAGATHATGSLRWFEDAYDDARACAAKLNRPLVVDLWAPWCHTCLSMQHEVFPDPVLAPLADRFVFVALDTDREVNAAAVAALPPAAWPTFYVISPDGTVQARLVGAATAPQFAALLDDGAAGHAAHMAMPDAPAPSPADVALRQADRAAAEGRLADAVEAYGQALAAAPADWPRRPDVLVNRIAAMAKLDGGAAACVAFAEGELAGLARRSARTDFLVYATMCAEQLAAAEPDRVRALRVAAATSLAELADASAAPLSTDDRSDTLLNLREVQVTLGQADAARATAERQRALLDRAAAAAASPRAAMTYNWPRAEVYAFLGVPLELVPALEASAAALPDEYDPPHRLAFLYQQAGKPDLALPWANKALALAYGPRKARIQKLVDELDAAIAKSR